MDWSAVDYYDVFIRRSFWRHPFTWIKSQYDLKHSSLSLAAFYCYWTRTSDLCGSICVSHESSPSVTALISGCIISVYIWMFSLHHKHFIFHVHSLWSQYLRFCWCFWVLWWWTWWMFSDKHTSTNHCASHITDPIRERWNIWVIFHPINEIQKCVTAGLIM